MGTTAQQLAREQPVRWLKQTFGATFWQRQQDVLNSFRDNRVTLVPSCHASGKSFTAAHAFDWALYTHGHSKVISTATTWHQVESILWSEIRASHVRHKDRVKAGKTHLLHDKDPLTTSIELAPDWLGFGVSTNNPVSMQGQHARGGVFMIVDEGDGIEPEIWDGIKANLSTGDCRLLVIGNPVDPESVMAKMCSDHENSIISIDAFGTPNFTAFGITLEDIRSGGWTHKMTGPLPAPWLITPEWVAAMWREEGEESPFFISRVLARWPDVSEDALIKQSWIEKAWARWPSAKDGTPRAIGHDVARYGDDKTVTAVRRGMKFFVAATGNGLDSDKAAEQAMRISALELLEAGSDRANRPSIFVDVAGVGAGVYDILKKQERAIAVDNATRASKPEKFLNRRAEMYWNFREMLRTQEIALDPTDRALAAELRSIRYKIGHGKVQIEEKADIKRRLKRSPDRADAIVLAAGSDSSTALGFLQAMQGR